MIKKILIANRGEIAVRIIKACKELGIPTVAIYSQIDKNSLHVQFADEAYCVGSSPLESYLNFENILSVIKKSNADAVHPGYGFLSENPDFVEFLEKNGIIFIGSSSESIRKLGLKTQAREMMEKAGVPVIPGMKGKFDQNIATFKKEAERIGYPVLIKASAGGGGKGMRIAENEQELEMNLESAKRECLKSFGDDTVYIEKYIKEPRHIEFQVLADKFGNIVHLYERECSIQRRYQKIIEETPSTALDEKLRKRMAEAAITVIKTAKYYNAGTVEFLLDKNNNFYFLEVNTRLQVEHPITEVTTGIDIVKEQIKIAAGEKLSIKQEDVIKRGHAIECRIYAEDPENNFLPSPGKILYVKEPIGPGIRVDSGIYSGIEIPIYYDPIISKLIAWANTREETRRKIDLALSNYIILGIKTTIKFLKDVINHPAFIKGETYTNFINTHFKNYKEKGKMYTNEALIVSAIIELEKINKKKEVKLTSIYNPWQTIGKWELFQR
jgi:acetyl-CoA carboxylase biotin carboxylase subunit